MKEIVFLNENAERWKNLETIILSKEKKDPDYVAEIYIKITDDLSYAQTYYPGSETEKYLNSLATKIHQAIYKTKKEDQNRFSNFWKYEIPAEMLGIRKYILYSFLIFAVTFLIGIVSSANDAEYSRIILGDSYVNMTIDNIEKGDPMGVYKDSDSLWMFVYIAWNNIKVMMIVYLLGLFISLGSIYIIIRHGIMIGTFQYLFYEYNVLYESVTTIWIHGTIEIFTLVVAGGAGIMLGNSILFPGTYSRKISFIKGARSSTKIVIALIPFIITAAFLEGFITRHTEWHPAIRIGIIAGSFIFIIWYFFLYPIFLNRKSKKIKL
ncbi:MAG: stage II sporulation protein M [Bacteroidales bacterium]|nr:stage II sporulation protein M [Bacteroidales bacterium]